MNKFFLLIMVMNFVLPFTVQAQSYNMANANITTCGGNFYDNGGSSGNYSNSQFLIFTACAGQPLNQIQVSFSSFSLEASNDFLYIYDGSNTFAPLLGIFSGTINPGIFTSSNGCLTFVFISNSSVNAAGWVSTLNCISTAPAPCSVTGCLPGGSPPLNDACINATSLGSLPAPANCPNGMGTTIGVAGSTSCANPENPFFQQQGCLTNNNMPAPAADVWYTFTITGSVLNVQIQGMSTPSAALWQGTGCTNLIGRGCAIGSAGILNATFQALTPGQYYLQISGGSSTDQCNFTLLLKNNRDCSACTVNSGITANPAPVNGTYTPGQTVTFCYSVSSFNQTSANWLHGIVPQFGSGWDMSTLTNLTPANSCSGQGIWSWYANPITSSATGTVAGPGFFYETWQGSPSGVADSYPGNNYGDNNSSGNCIWTFCWTITTKSGVNCIQNSDLTIDVLSYGDGETGSWSSLACTTDPPATAIASLQCCSTPLLSFTNPNCSGGAYSGSATGTGQGSGPWTYSWYIGNVMFQSNVNQNGPSTINGLIPGNYTFTTTDVNGCSSSAYFTITSPSTLNVTINKTNASCGVNNGTATANVTGGIPPITYLWSNSGTTSTINNLGPGIVSATATDANGCSIMASTNITQPSAPILNMSSTNVNCFGGSNGSATVTPIGGTAPFQYQWSNSHTTSSINNLPANNYSVTVTDSNGCVITGSTTVNQPQTGITASISSLTQTSCDSATGSASVNVNGGTAPYYYLWSNNATSSFVDGLLSGNISVTVTDIVGCAVTATATITQATAPTLSATVINHPSCFGLGDGTASATVSGGSPPYIYNWSSGDSNAIASNLNSGIYNVTVTDANGCSASASVNLNAPTSIVPYVVTQSNVSCFGDNNGSVTVNATGGTGNYSYVWSSGGNSSSIANLNSNTYTAIVTDGNGCTASITVTISQPGELTSTISNNDVSCFGGNDGSAYIVPQGGTLPYQFNWSSGDTTSLISGLIANNYNVTVTDANGCTITSSVVIAEPPELSLSLITTTANCTIADGTALAVVSGGIGNYFYNWSSGSNSALATDLPSGNIHVTITDQNNCAIAAGSTIGINSNLSILASNVTDVSCNGGNDGEIILSPTGGTEPIAYDWFPSVSNTQSATGLNAGNYQITLTDSNGCNVSQTVSINEPGPLNLQILSTPATCDASNGSANVVVTGGVGNYSYQWSSGDTSSLALNLLSGISSVTVTDANGCFVQETIMINNIPGPVLSLSNVDQISCHGVSDGSAGVLVSGGTGNISYDWTNSSSTTNSATSLAQGNYTVIATDANGCTSSVQFIISEPDSIDLNLSKTDVTCFGNNDGIVTAIATGGTGNLNYSWSGLPSGGSQLNNLAPGVYTLNVNDQNGCFITDSIIIIEPQQIVIGTSHDDTICKGQSTTISVSGTGGTGGLSYLWTHGEIDSIIVVLPQAPSHFSVIATDINGCKSDTQSVYINHYSTLIVQAPILDKICPGQYQDLIPVVTGGDGVYSFLWNEGQTTSTINVAPLSDKNYSVTVTDGCGTKDSIDILVTVEVLPVISFLPDENNGCEHLEVNFINSSTAPPGSSYLWDFGDNTTSSIKNPTKNYSITGTYDVSLTITTPIGCVSSKTIPEAVQIFPVPISAFTYSPAGEFSVHNSKVTFLDLSQGALYWNWSFGDGKGASIEQNPFYMYPDFGTFQVSLIVTNDHGCSDTSSQRIKIEDNFSIFFPNTFTPDGDGTNDFFYAFGEGFQNFNMKIFDRWGKIVFKSDSAQFPWNGKIFNMGEDCPIGVYVYSVYVTDPSGKFHSFKGTVNLLR